MNLQIANKATCHYVVLFAHLDPDYLTSVKRVC